MEAQKVSAPIQSITGTANALFKIVFVESKIIEITGKTPGIIKDLPCLSKLVFPIFFEFVSYIL